jgi:hypothetical protein
MEGALRHRKMASAGFWGIFSWLDCGDFGYGVAMKSCLGTLLVMGVFLLVVGGGLLIWHLSATAEYSRADPPREQTR